jgi:hypothetical protein
MSFFGLSHSCSAGPSLQSAPPKEKPLPHPARQPSRRTDSPNCPLWQALPAGRSPGRTEQGRGRGATVSCRTVYPPQPAQGSAVALDRRSWSGKPFLWPGRAARRVIGRHPAGGVPASLAGGDHAATLRARPGHDEARSGLRPGAGRAGCRLGAAGDRQEGEPVRHQPGNGSSKVMVHQTDMGGWVCIYTDRPSEGADDLPVFLSHALTRRQMKIV